MDNNYLAELLFGDIKTTPECTQREHNNLADTWAFAYAQLYRKQKRWK